MTDSVERCTGMKSCTASPHVHGCYADVGDCDNALDHISGSIKPPVVADPADSRQQLQEALADAMYAKVRDEGFIAADMAAAVMDALSEAGWVPRAEHEAALAISNELRRHADRAAAHEACIKRRQEGWKCDMGEWYLPFSGTRPEPMSPAEQEAMRVVMSRG